MDCIFCDIANKKARAKITYESENFMAFENIDPQAPIHLLLIPKNHIEKDISLSRSGDFWKSIMMEAENVIIKTGLNKTGYRIVNNGAGYHAINHEHIHILGGENWRPNDNL